MEYKIGDLVTVEFISNNHIFKIVCFYDRGPNLACPTHKVSKIYHSYDDAHLELIWASHNSVPPFASWKVGMSIAAAVEKLCPVNGILALALSNELEEVDRINE